MFLSFFNICIAVLYLAIAVLYVVLFYTEKKVYHHTVRLLIYLNLLLHCFYFIYSGILEGRVPLTTAYRVISFLTLVITGTYVSVESKLETRSLGAIVFPFLFTLHVISIFGSGIFRVDMDIFNTPLFGFHTISSVIGYSAFAYSMILGVMYLHLFGAIKKKKLDFIDERFPPLETLEKMNSLSQLGGFLLLTIGIATGVMMAQIEWNKVPIFDPKIYLTTLIWLVYLISIIAKYLLKWGGRRIAYMSVLGFCFLVVVFIGVNFILPTIHKF